MKLKRSFFTQPSLEVAKRLLGKYIIRKIGRVELIGKIVETEAYPYAKDKASHTYLPRHLRIKAGGGKRTHRTEAEYLIGGHIYIYLVYGMYWQLNITTGKKEHPECVLIRAIEPICLKSKEMKNITNGPGKLCRWLNLDKSFYGEDLTKSERIWLIDRYSSAGLKVKTVKPSDIMKGSRINIDYAGPYWALRHFRFWIKDNPFVSK